MFMKSRALLLLMVIFFIFSGYIGAEVYESKLAASYANNFVKPADTPNFSDNSSISSIYNPESFDPVEPSTDSSVWDREVNYLQSQNILRYGWGPELSDQVERSYSGDEKTVIVVGDSFVWGQSVEDTDMRWDRRLEQELNKLGNDRYRVVTLARLGASTMEESDWLTNERLAKIRPDAIVVGFLQNDMAPSYHEKEYCTQYGICIDDGEALAAGNPRNVSLLKCLLGNESIFGRVLRNHIMPRWPNIGRVMVKRWCDPDRAESAEYANLFSQGRSISDPKREKSWPYFIKSVKSIKRVAGDTPIFMADTRNNLWGGKNVPAGNSAFSDAGFDLIEMLHTRETVENTPTAQLFINPSDPHPGPALTIAYAKDTASAILRRLESGEVVGSKVNKPVNLISNYLPAYLNVESMPTGEIEVVSAPLDQKQSHYFGMWYDFGNEELGTMTAPCGRMGRPHARVMLDSEIPSGSTVRLTLNASSESLVVQPVGYQDRSILTADTAFLIRVGEFIDYKMQDGITGFLIGGSKAGCSVGGKQLPLFKLIISQ